MVKNTYGHMTSVCIQDSKQYLLFTRLNKENFWLEINLATRFYVEQMFLCDWNKTEFVIWKMIFCGEG
jgi:hypothetical protein